MKEEPCESFFNFFSPPEVLDEGDAEDMDEEEVNMRSAEIDLDYDMAMYFLTQSLNQPSLHLRPIPSISRLDDVHTCLS